jgi:hypothetical protein
VELPIELLSPDGATVYSKDAREGFLPIPGSSVVVPLSRIYQGFTVVRDIDFSTSLGQATLTLNYQLNGSGFIIGNALEDLNAQVPGAGGIPGVGYYAVGVERPREDVTHVVWNGVLSWAPTFNYSGSNAIGSTFTVFNGFQGRYWYHNIAKEVDEAGAISQGSGNWVPIGGTTYDYTLHWYVGDPAVDGVLVSIETFIVTVINASVPAE